MRVCPECDCLEFPMSFSLEDLPQIWFTMSSIWFWGFWTGRVPEICTCLNFNIDDYSDLFELERPKEEENQS